MKLIELGEIPKTKSTLYLLPSLGLSSTELLNVYPDFNSNNSAFKVLEFFGFKNLYLEDINSSEKHPNSLIMLFNPDLYSLDKWFLFYNVYKTKHNYIKTEDLDTGVISITFNISKEKWYPLKDCLKRSKYSEMDKSYSQFVFTHYDKEKGAVINWQHSVITKSEILRLKMSQELGFEFTKDMELDSAIDLEEEILDYPKLKEKYEVRIDRASI